MWPTPDACTTWRIGHICHAGLRTEVTHNVSTYARQRGRFTRASARLALRGRPSPDRRSKAAFVGEVDVDEAADRLRDHLFSLRNGPGQPRPVNFDNEQTMLDVERKAASVTDLPVPACEDSGRNVFDSKPLLCDMPVSGDGHAVNDTSPVPFDVGNMARLDAKPFLRI